MRTSRSSFTLLCRFAAIFTVLLAGCPDSGGKSGEGNEKRGKMIRIYSSLPRTGSAKGQTDTIVNGITLALEEVNYKIGEFTIDYQDLDDATAAAGKWTADAETANADKAKDDPDAMVYIGTYNSGAAKVSMPILNRAGLLMVSPANTWPGLTKPGLGNAGEPEIYQPSGKKNFVRVVPADDLQGTLAADWAKSMGMKTVYLLDDNEVYGKGIADMFALRCEENGLKLLGRQSISADSQEFKTLFTAIKAERPDLVYFGGTTQTKGGQIAKDMSAVGLDAKLMVPDGCYEKVFIDSAGAENINGRCYVTFGGFPPDKLTGAGAEFVKNYRARFKTEPEAYAVYGYESARVALAAIRQAGVKDREAIRKAAFELRDFEGALGKWSFDENGDTTLKSVSGNEVINGDFSFVKLLGDAPSE